MKSLVTGGSGFVGSAVVRQLLEAGHEVRCLVRPGRDHRNLQRLPVETSTGNLREPDTLKRALRGCDHLFHVAADYRLWIPDPDAMYEVNVKGTENLLLAAHAEGVERIVYTSSVATLGLNPDRSPANEKTPSSLSDMTGHYKRSKFLAEQKAWQLTQQLNLPLVIVNPSTPIGPRDIRPTPTGRIVVDTLNGKMPAYVNTGLNIVHVDDVARGHLLAFSHGHVGERYILGGEDMTLFEILKTIDELTGVQHRRLRLPHQVILPVAYIMEGMARITGTDPRITVDSVHMSSKTIFSIAKKLSGTWDTGFVLRARRWRMQFTGLLKTATAGKLPPMKQ